MPCFRDSVVRLKMKIQKIRKKLREVIAFTAQISNLKLKIFDLVKKLVPNEMSVEAFEETNARLKSLAAFQPPKENLNFFVTPSVPTSCSGCTYLHGGAIVCAIHPMGKLNCPDREILIKLQDFPLADFLFSASKADIWRDNKSVKVFVPLDDPFYLFFLKDVKACFREEKPFLNLEFYLKSQSFKSESEPPTLNLRLRKTIPNRKFRSEKYRD